MKRIILASVMLLLSSNSWSYGTQTEIQWKEVISCTEGLSVMRADSWSGSAGHMIVFEPSISGKAEQSLETQWGDYIDLSFVTVEAQGLNYYVGNDDNVRIEIDARNFKNIVFKISDATTNQKASFSFKYCR